MRDRGRTEDERGSGRTRANPRKGGWRGEGGRRRQRKGSRLLTDTRGKRFPLRYVSGPWSNTQASWIHFACPSSSALAPSPVPRLPPRSPASESPRSSTTAQAKDQVRSPAPPPPPPVPASSGPRRASSRRPAGTAASASSASPQAAGGSAAGLVAGKVRQAVWLSQRVDH